MCAGSNQAHIKPAHIKLVFEMHRIKSALYRRMYDLSAMCKMMDCVITIFLSNHAGLMSL